MSGDQMDREQVRFNERVKEAVRGVEPPPYLEARVRNHIHAARKPVFGPRYFAAALGAVVICFGLFASYQMGYPRFLASPRESYIADVSSRAPSIMRVGLGDHIHCSVYRKYPKDAPTVEELMAGMTPEFRGLVSIAKACVPDDYHLTMAHSCRYHLRKFVHLSLRKDTSLMSIVIAEKGGGESLPAEGLAAALQSSGIPIYQSVAQPYQIAAFESGMYLVYVVSDLTPKENTAMVVALAPSVREFLGRM